VRDHDVYFNFAQLEESGGRGEAAEEGAARDSLPGAIPGDGGAAQGAQEGAHPVQQPRPPPLHHHSGTMLRITLLSLFFPLCLCMILIGVADTKPFVSDLDPDAAIQVITDPDPFRIRH